MDNWNWPTTWGWDYGMTAMAAARLGQPETALKALPVCRAMALKGNPASASDAGVGALAAVAGIRGAELNVRINAAGLKDREAAGQLTARAAEIVRTALAEETEILKLVNQHIDHE